MLTYYADKRIRLVSKGARRLDVQSPQRGAWNYLKFSQSVHQ